MSAVTNLISAFLIVRRGTWTLTVNDVTASLLITVYDFLECNVPDTLLHLLLAVVPVVAVLMLLPRSSYRIVQAGRNHQ